MSFFHQRWSRLVFLFMVSRPLLWFIVFIPFFLGFFENPINFNLVMLLQILVLTFPINFFAYAINDIYDYESDKLNERKGSVYGTIIEPKDYAFVKKIAFLMAFLSLFSSVLTFKIENILLMAALLLLVYFYSAKPVRLKERPPLDSLSNGLMFLLVYLFGFSLSGGNIFSVHYRVFLLALCVSGIHAVTTIIDFDSDKAANHKTFSTVFGKRAAAIFAFLSFTLTNLLSRSPNLFVNLFMYLMNVVLFLIILKPEKRFTFLAIKYTSIVLILAWIIKLVTLRV